MINLGVLLYLWTLATLTSSLRMERDTPWLPPKRTIQHHIDLIPGAIVPNKPAYRINPKETMEIQRQVEELISKGLIRKVLAHVRYPPS